MVDAGHDVLRAEGDLLGLSEEIVDIGVERQRADDLDRDLFFRNDLGRVEHVEFELLGKLLVEHLDAEVPLRIVARVDRIPHVAAMEVGIHPVDLERLVPDHRLQPERGLPVELDEMRLALGIDQPEGMYAEAFHEAEATRDRAVGHDPHDHVHRFGAERDEVPEIVMRGLRLREAAIGRGLGGVDQIGELDRVLDEEHRDIVADEVPIALAGVELGGKAAHVARQVGRTLVARHGGEAREGRHLDADLVEDRRARILRDRLLQLEMAVHPVAARMDHALGDPFVVEVEDLLARDLVFEQLRPARTRAQPVLVVGDLVALRGGHHVVVVLRLLVVCAAFRQFEFLGHVCLLHLVSRPP